MDGFNDSTFIFNYISGVKRNVFPFFDEPHELVNFILKSILLPEIYYWKAKMRALHGMFFSVTIMIGMFNEICRRIFIEKLLGCLKGLTKYRLDEI